MATFSGSCRTDECTRGHHATGMATARFRWAIDGPCTGLPATWDRGAPAQVPMLERTESVEFDALLSGQRHSLSATPAGAPSDRQPVEAGSMVAANEQAADVLAWAG